MDRAVVTSVSATEQLVAAVVLAFAADPFVRWMMPRSHTFMDVFGAITSLHGLRTAQHGGAWALSDGRGAAFWYPPGVHPDGEALGAAFAQAEPPDDFGAVWREVERHEPGEPHWYLRQIGVDPMLQRRGYGAALLEAGLAEVDRNGAVAYLEATSPASRVLYERHGFETLAEVGVDGSPPLWPMVRWARG